MKKIIKVTELKKKYGDIEAVKGISFGVNEGQLFAFLGTNGAGKSTTINILTSLLEKTSGEVLIDDLRLGEKDAEIRELIGVVYQNSTLDDVLTVTENLKVRGSLYLHDKRRLKEQITKVARITGCDAFLGQRYGKLSGGQRRRVDIASALLHNPKILFLDEPTTGLDPSTRISIWETISNMQEKMNMTVFLTTHYMEEAAQADDIVIIDNGMIIEHDTPINLKKKYAGDLIKIYNTPKELVDLLNKDKIPFTYIFEKETILIEISECKGAIEFLCSYKELIDSFEVIKGNMDDVFVNCIKLKGAKI